MSEITIRKFQMAQALSWLSCGTRLFRRRPLEALRPAVVFALAALLVLKIPILGNVLLLLFLPTLVASYLTHADFIARTGNAPRPRGGKNPFYIEWARELKQATIGAWSQTPNIFPLMAMGLALVLLGLVAMYLFMLIGGQAVVSPYHFFELTIMQKGQVLLAYGVLTLWWAVITPMVVWSLPMLVMRDMGFGESFGWGVRGMLRNLGPAMLFVLLPALLLVPATIVKPWLPLGHFFIQWLMLTVFSVLAGLSTYCSYRLVYADAQQPARGAPPRPPTNAARPVVKRP